MALVKDNSRPHRVLKMLAEKSGWGKALQNKRGRGVAVRTCFGSTAGHVAEVSVDKQTGRITVHRLVCAVDCGPAVYPDAIVAQMEGGAIFALSAAMKEKVEFSKGGVSSSNYDDYPILKMSETPEIEVHIVPSEDKVGGIGELGVPTVAPAVANAVFDAIGLRMKTLPMTSENVLSALAAA
jgi:isoquinoline 1-oxidoreductase beta subunit